MKLLALAPVQLKKSLKVKLYQYRDIEIPLNIVARNYLIDMERPVPGESDYPDYNLGPHIQEFDIRIKGTSIACRGIICYERLEDLVNFFLDYYQPVNNTMIDYILKKTRNLDRRKRKKIVLDTVVRESMAMLDEDYVSMSVGQTFWSRGLETKSGPAFNCREFFKTSRFRAIDTVDGPAFVKEAKHQHIVYLPGLKKANFWLIHRHYINSGKVCLWWNGEELRAFLRVTFDRDFFIGAMGEKQYQEFEKNARATEAFGECFPSPAFQIKYRIRVPARKELMGYFSEKKIEQIKSSVDFGRILFLYEESLAAVKMTQEYPLITSFDDVIYLLSRSPNGIYVCGEHPAEAILKKYLENKEYYLIAGVINEQF